MTATTTDVHHDDHGVARAKIGHPEPAAGYCYLEFEYWYDVGFLRGAEPNECGDANRPGERAPVTLAYCTNGNVSVTYGPTSVTIPAGSSFATAVFTVSRSGASNAQNFALNALASGYSASLSQTETVESDAAGSLTLNTIFSPR
jgi:hypothetical protein